MTNLIKHFQLSPAFPPFSQLECEYILKCWQFHERPKLTEETIIFSIALPSLTRTRSSEFGENRPELSREIQMPRHARRWSSSIRMKYSCYARQQEALRDNFHEENTVVKIGYIIHGRISRCELLMDANASGFFFFFFILGMTNRDDKTFRHVKARESMNLDCEMFAYSQRDLVMTHYGK